MRIKPTQIFLHGKDRYSPDETYDVAEALGGYFVLNGWAEDLDGVVPTGEPATGEVALDVHDSSHPTTST